MNEISSEWNIIWMKYHKNEISYEWNIIWMKYHMNGISYEFLIYSNAAGHRHAKKAEQAKNSLKNQEKLYLKNRLLLYIAAQSVVLYSLHSYYVITSMYPCRCGSQRSNELLTSLTWLRIRLSANLSTLDPRWYYRP